MILLTMATMMNMTHIEDTAMKWDDRYSEETFIFGLEPNSFLSESSHLLPKGGKILCLAEGEGRNALDLLNNGFDVHAVDLSTVGMKKAKDLAKTHGHELSYEIADLFEYDFGADKWDGIVSIFFHTPEKLRADFHQKIEKALKKGGIYLFEGYAKEQLQFATGGPKEENLLYRANDFNALQLEPLHHKAIEREVFEGTYHTGQSAVIQYIGKKL